MSTTHSSLSKNDVAILEGMFEAAARMIRTGDWAGWADLYADDAVLHPPNGPAVHGRSALLAWGDAFPPVQALRFFDVRLFADGDVVWGTSAYELTVEGQRPDTGKQLLVCRRTPGGWKVVAVSFNSDLPLPWPA